MIRPDQIVAELLMVGGLAFTAHVIHPAAATGLLAAYAATSLYRIAHLIRHYRRRLRGTR